MSDSSAPSSPGIIHEFPRDRIDEHINGNSARARLQPMYIPPPYLPGGKRALSGISLRAFALGLAVGVSTVLGLELAYWHNGLWRAPCFIAVLALFHYLEFDLTSRYNPADASISSFLLSSNGVGYAAAHTSAMLELLVRLWLYSSHAPAWLSLPFHIPRILPSIPASVSVGLGLTLIVVGQLVRSAAMRTAKTSFNHIVQWTKRADHVLVTDGVYAFSRHPSYFGFFWWGLGTQVLLGNRICFVLYAAILWKFFHHRIILLPDEEQHLVSFFGQDYLDYRERVPVRIPFIR
ncbi:Protein-S-isoprenylcysteine O-methyltransferase [Cladophialophora carrionii]|uniref:Protein-S-isoprenylcysteine O-methyltransferase n=1 Tax=Cladophialophora carrionii TaxID=86049 RepID=A0A1C1CXE1_9EURO|nr:Protein-S-isoprenylcysteine O-methyltransferase [Cladophialophora carrionii]